MRSIVLFLFFPAILIPSANAAVTVNLVREWIVDDAQSVLGLDVWGAGSMTRIIFVDPDTGGGSMGSFDPATGETVGMMPVSSANQNGFGVTFDAGPADTTWYTNDRSVESLFYSDDLSAWGTLPNPALNDGAGMDFDGDCCWETCGDSGVYRFQPGGTQEFVGLPEVPEVMSGLAVFPLGSSTGLVVTCFQSEELYFYEWDGSSAGYLGSAPCPSPVKSSCNHGLAYCSSSGTLFWSYVSPADQLMLAELSFDTGSVLQQSTWGLIKTFPY